MSKKIEQNVNGKGHIVAANDINIENLTIEQVIHS